MFKTNSELRREARLKLDGHWGQFVLATLLLLVFYNVASSPRLVTGIMNDLSRNSQALHLGMGLDASTLAGLAIAGSLASFILYVALMPLTWSYQIMFLQNSRSIAVEYSNLFDGYKDLRRILGTMLLQMVLVLLWMLLLVVPGIIKSMAYALSPFILKDYPELSGKAALQRSEEMMKGKKQKLFLLYLSFIGWAILCLASCGIGFLWLYPYMYASLAAFYEDIKFGYEAEQLAESMPPVPNAQ